MQSQKKSEDQEVVICLRLVMKDFQKPGVSFSHLLFFVNHHNLERYARDLKLSVRTFNEENNL